MKALRLLGAFLLLSFRSALAQTASLDFIENARQWPEVVRYKANLPGGAVFLTDAGFTYSYYSQQDLIDLHELQHHDPAAAFATPVHFHAYSVRFTGSNPAAEKRPYGKQPYYHNYFLGSDPSKWAGHVGLYSGVEYAALYPGIDLRVYGKGVSLKYDFIVAPGANAGDISLQFTGVQPRLLRNGDLEIRTSVNTIVEKAPYAWQIVDGKKVTVPCRYRLQAGKLGFDFPAGFDAARELVIDPVLVFTTYSGSTTSTFGFSATYDNGGHLYAGGEAFGAGWPVTTGAFQTTFGTGVDAGINKYSPNGSSLVYSTYFGGSGQDLPNNLFVNNKNELVMCGSTASPNMPHSTGCFDSTHNGGADLYVARFGADGATLRAATYVGGSAADGMNLGSLSPNYGDANRGEVFQGPDGDIYVASSTSSIDFPATAGAFQTARGGGQDACVFRLDSACKLMRFCTYLGGGQDDAAFSLGLTSTGRVLVCGGTKSPAFPTTPGSFHPAYQDSTDGFVSMFSTNGDSLLRSTFLGTTSYDHAFKLQVAPGDSVYVCGQTDGAYPVSGGVYSTANGDIFIQKLSPDLSTGPMSTRIGNNNVLTASQRLVPTAFLYDQCGNTYFCGFFAAQNLPVSANAHQTNPGSFWLSVLTGNFSSLLYATYMGSGGDHVDGGTSRFDPQGIVYHSVCTIGGLAGTPGAWRPTNQANGFDVVSFKFNFEAAGVSAAIANAAGKDSFCVGTPVQFVNNSIQAQSYEWDFGDNSPKSPAAAPSHTYTVPGVYTVSMHARNPNLCVTDDTAYLKVYVFKVAQPMLTMRDTVVCTPDNITLTARVSNYHPNMRFEWSPASAVVSGLYEQSAVVNPALSTIFSVKVTDSVGNICREVVQGTTRITVFDVARFKASGDTIICKGDTAWLRAEGGDFYSWYPDVWTTGATQALVGVRPDRKTVYHVKISNQLGCAAEKTLLVDMYPPVVANAGEDNELMPGESVQLSGSGGGSYNWTPAETILSGANTANPLVAPRVNTTYTMNIVSPEGCEASDDVTIRITYIRIPNAFSPNGDGRNDRFRIWKTTEGVYLDDFSIFDRWGKRIWQTKDINEGWDGVLGGRPVELGVYHYSIVYTIGHVTYHEKGDVSLIR